jgi:hypothetical protein
MMRLARGAKCNFPIAPLTSGAAAAAEPEFNNDAKAQLPKPLVLFSKKSLRPAKRFLTVQVFASNMMVFDRLIGERFIQIEEHIAQGRPGGQLCHIQILGTLQVTDSHELLG